MSKFIVMDIVFYGGSLNYDQGTGNYQELKKVTKWDGKQYTLVSRYALRYSLLETAKEFGWKLASAEEFDRSGSGEKTVIQPATYLLLSGEIMRYPEFNLFGYLITSTAPQNFREAPVKISHAVSMTPFNYDALFYANIGLANRLRAKYGKMDPNPFTAEEHYAFYQYTVVIDVDKARTLEVYLSKKDKQDFLVNGEKLTEKLSGIVIEGDKLLFKVGKKEISFTIPEDIKVEVEEKDEVYKLTFTFKNDEKLYSQIEGLVKALLHLKRNIKGRSEDLSPKVLILGLYENEPYNTYRDAIELLDESIEEEYNLVEEETGDGKKITKIVHKVTKSKKPLFKVYGIESAPVLLSPSSIDNITNEIISFLKGEKETSKSIKVFHVPSVKVEVATT